ncbi:hypothetical protein BU17DRAFT_62706 [Hysterangium stoloniferum]|nr:hypothetical protein BU17DRAFT_62706 [Hysterangium stoloniferum]
MTASWLDVSKTMTPLRQQRHAEMHHWIISDRTIQPTQSHHDNVRTTTSIMDCLPYVSTAVPPAAHHPATLRSQRNAAAATSAAVGPLRVHSHQLRLFLLTHLINPNKQGNIPEESAEEHSDKDERVKQTRGE